MTTKTIWAAALVVLSLFAGALAVGVGLGGSPDGSHTHDGLAAELAELSAAFCEEHADNDYCAAADEGDGAGDGDGAGGAGDSPAPPTAPDPPTERTHAPSTPPTSKSAQPASGDADTASGGGDGTVTTQNGRKVGSHRSNTVACIAPGEPGYVNAVINSPDRIC